MVIMITNYGLSETFSLTERLKKIHNKLLREDEAMRICANDLHQMISKTKISINANPEPKE
jgi:hypothetical protein